MMHRGLFLDRDGTINEEVEYISSPQQLQLIPRAAEAIREAVALGFKTVIISNQSGVARGMFSEEQLQAVNSTLIKMLRRENAPIDGLYYCPHHPEGGAPYNRDCDCRKPNIGMLTKAKKEFQIDLSRSFVVGDRISDIQAGINAGATPILVLTGYGKNQVTALQEMYGSRYHIANDLYEALQHIKKLVTEQPSSIS